MAHYNETPDKHRKVHSRYKHGMKGTREHETWANIRARCTNQNRISFKNYGGRGIKVCARWDNFVNFYADMGPRPSDAHSIDRINNDGNYEPGNCRWATRDQQNSNRRNNLIVDYRGDRMTLTAAVLAAGSVISSEGARYRIFQLGWPVERALEIPASPDRNSKGQWTC